MIYKLLTDYHLEFLSLKGGCTGSSKSTLVKMPHRWKSHVAAQVYVFVLLFTSEGIHPVVEYPQLLLKENDKFINHTSKNIYGEEKINPMFRELGASGQFIYEQNDLYLHKKQTYHDMVLHLLQNWVRRAGRGATLDVLCQMLKQHGFYPVTIELLAIWNEQH